MIHTRTILLPLLLGTLLLGTAPGQDDQQKTFGSADEAIEALIKACETNSEAALIEIFGREFAHLAIEDPIEAKMRRTGFARGARQTLTREQTDEGIVLVVGPEEWPFPIPLVKSGARWRWDTAAGVEELINRRVGENELNAVATCLAYIEAQVEYAERDWDGDRVREYAQRVASTPGKKDGLYWEAGPGEAVSPLDEYVAAAGPYTPRQEPRPFLGYNFRILTRQGDAAPGGAHGYVINGNMIAGCALIASPARYGVSGIMTFIISHEGVVYEKDLGEGTAEIVKYIHEYNPDKTWSRVEEE